MPHLHLPSDHTDADLVLAANLAEIVGSEELYVAWTHESGAGAVPEVDALLMEARRPSAFSELFAAFATGVAACWRALIGRRADAEVAPAPSARHARRGAGEPSV
jgi:hypothetical protein